ncbi:RagB/SusD family nutrient uptake outer membrane protein [Fulvivirga sp. M361]|uniref:RagB/SusD family nutrient uptake outer membrane protein n=1 Tax=Fulvivirga sp. M361 TaxID=2594266 RepID=UPI001179938B|nr:RagB/SusD family nutrient uptake outer membrane protein [Fulvivirga sp. M361]TRX60008.1 RagB/SusD family nutrient uptake outer membrane protein [Fulvivirga sp. M361]
MKTYYIVLITLICLQGCDDFLDVTPETQFTPATFFQNEEQVDRAVVGAYAKNKAIHNSLQWKFGEFRSDNASFQFNSSDRGGIALEAVDEFIMNADNSEIRKYWEEAYDGIGRCNYVLENIDGVRFSSTSQRDLKIGEVLFMRTWYYFNLVRLYGDVPFVESTFATLEESLGEEFTTLVSAEVIYDSLFIDAQRAIDGLPVQWELENTGRATKGAALMLKAKMHMTLREFNEAIPLLEEVQSMGYELQDDYESIFNPANKNNKESIFEIQYSFELGQASDFLSSFVPFNSGGDILGGVFRANSRAGRNQPTQDLMDLYEDEDERKAVNIGLYITDAGDTIPFMNKYNYPLLDAGAQDVNWPMFRYADALLMLAECLNEVNGLDQNAIGIINLIRLRAGVRPLSDTSSDPDLVVITADDLRLAIERERRLELAFENHRWFDLVRTGKAESVMIAHGTAQKNEKTTVSGEAYTNIRTTLGYPTNQVQQFGYPQKPEWN